MDLRTGGQLPPIEGKRELLHGVEGRKDAQTGYFTPTTKDDSMAYSSKPTTKIDLVKWPTTALLGLALRLAAQVVIGSISRLIRNTRHESYISGHLARNELLDLIYLITDLMPGKIYQLPADEWIYGKLQPVPLHRLHELVSGHIFDTKIWGQAAREQYTREIAVTSLPQRTKDKAIEGHPIPIGYPKSARNPTPIINLYLGGWNVNDMFGLAMAVAGQALIGAIIHRGWDTNTFQHDTWEFDWEELAALIYLTTEYRTDRQYPTTAEHFYGVIMQPQDILRLHWLVRGDIYDTATWVAVAHAQLDRESAQAEDNQDSVEDTPHRH